MGGNTIAVFADQVAADCRMLKNNVRRLRKGIGEGGYIVPDGQADLDLTAAARGLKEAVAEVERIHRDLLANAPVRQMQAAE